MPQMSPSNWIILFLYFNMIMIIIITNNYFQLMVTPSLVKYYNKSTYIWKW